MSSATATPARDRPQPLRKLRLIVPLLLLVAGAGFGARYFFFQPEADGLEVSGRIEGYETNIAAKVAGRIAEITVREGDRVTSGQVIARLDAEELAAQLEGARARLAAAQQRETQAQIQLGVIQSQIDEAQLNRAQAQDDASSRVNQAQSNVAAAEAQLAQAKAQVEQAQAELALAVAERDRFAPLLDQGVIPQQQFDQVQTRLETTRATLAARRASVAAAEKQVGVARGSLQQAQTARFNPQIATTRLTGLQQQLAQARSQLAAAKAEVANAAAQVEEIAARRNDLNIVSPIAGIVLSRSVEPGEVVGSGSTLLTVVNLEDVYLRGYLPEGQIGLVRVGRAAKVYLDSAPDQPLEATVAAIDTEASFTPENIYFKEDRVQQVFGLKLAIENPGGFAKPGMPADGEIAIEATQLSRSETKAAQRLSSLNPFHSRR